MSSSTPTTPPYDPLDPSTYPDPTSLVQSMIALRASDPKLIKPTVYTHTTPGPSSRTRTISSWKMPEHLYRIHPSPLPTLARGLFTEPVESTEGGEGAEGEERYRIVARGYEKFFNTGEVPYTDWESLTKYTLPPYHLTLKSNGCLILVSAIEENVLLVTSKHALGESVSGPDKEEGSLNHAQMGRVWLDKHLAAKGRTEEELAKVLWGRKLTAVAELCDDSFEEHVLPYPPHLTGLHLHGLNANVAPDFFTLSPSDVAAFARDWGFIETRALVMDTLAEVRAFTRDVEERGEWEGEPVEGFVVRCTVGDGASLPIEDKLDALSLSEPIPQPPPPVVRTKGGKIKKEPPPRELVKAPYPTGCPFFFKIKFEQPYLLYRGFREITKCLLPIMADPPVEVKVPRSKMQDVDSILYEQWCRVEMGRHPDWFEGIKKGKGIVAVRERFLEWQKTEQGQAREKEVRHKFEGKGSASGAKVDDSGKKRGEDGWGKTILFPVAVPGCGKTALGLILSRLYNFGHTQSDDVQTKKTAATFCQNVTTLLKTHPVVFADRNNQLEQHRTQIATVGTKIQNPRTNPRPTRLIALHWPLSGPSQSRSFHELHRICSSRVLARGDKHQSLRVDPLDLMRHESILWRFIDSSEELERSECDEVIELKIEAGLEDNLEVVISRLGELLGLERKSDEEVDEAIRWAAEYDPEVRKEMDGTKSAEARYYALAPEIDVVEIVRRAAAGAGDDNGPAATSALAFLQHLLDNNRIIQKPHVTLIHEKEIQDEREAALATNSTLNDEDLATLPKATTWSHCLAISLDSSRPLFAFKMAHLVWTDRIMALSIEDVQPDSSSEGAQASDLELPQDDKDGMHVTVGTRDQEVPPFEARALVREFRERKGEKKEGVWSLRLVGKGGNGEGEEGKGRVKGMS